MGRVESFRHLLMAVLKIFTVCLIGMIPITISNPNNDLVKTKDKLNVAEDMNFTNTSTCKIKRGGYFDGYALGEAQVVQNPKECARRCFKNPQCKLWAWGLHSKTHKYSCYMKTKLGPWVSDGNWRAGNK